MMKQVTITCPTDGADIRYTIDGSYPSMYSKVYTYPFMVEEPLPGQPDITVRARAFKNGYSASNVITAFIRAAEMQNVPTPTLVLTRNADKVTGTISNLMEKASYYYSIGTPIGEESDGTLITDKTFSFVTTDAATVYVRGFAELWYPSDLVTQTIEAQPVCATPVILQEGNTITLTCSTPGATIHYSGCGLSGTCSSGYSFSISQSGTMTAYATLYKYITSSTASLDCVYTPPVQGSKLPTPQIAYAISMNSWGEIVVNYHITNESDYDVYFASPGSNIIIEFDGGNGYSNGDWEASTVGIPDTGVGFRLRDLSGYFQDSDEGRVQKMDIQATVDSMEHWLTASVHIEVEMTITASSCTARARYVTSEALPIFREDYPSLVYRCSTYTGSAGYPTLDNLTGTEICERNGWTNVSLPSGYGKSWTLMWNRARYRKVSNGDSVLDTSSTFSAGGVDPSISTGTYTYSSPDFTITFRTYY